MTADPAGTAAPPTGARRLLPDPPAARLVDHLARFGPLPVRGAELIGEVERAGLRGRGGAGFPTAVKMEAVRANGARFLKGRPPIVVANGTEGEPLSAKDKTLLVHAPHLVLDGAVAAANAIGADVVCVCVERRAAPVVRALQHAIDERNRSRADGIELKLGATPSRYVAGEETALIHWLNGGDAKPTFTPPRPFERGVVNRPTLVDNVETLAHVGLIARFGAQWYRSAGTAREPGTMLVTVNGVERPGVYEVPLGTSLRHVLRNAGAHDVAGVLVGGYFGTWLTPQQAAMVSLTAEDLTTMHAALGCGALGVIGAGACPVAEIARITRWFANQSAGQCGPCTFGLPAIADALDHMARGADRDGRAEAAARRWLAMVEGRGACKLPDGAVRFVRSGLAVFADHVAEHRTTGRCRAPGGAPALPVPRAEASWR
ncbi:MAG TPA: NADH-ubiquinone oxidoreductase-F iron-sulfur binding region domain-containing protein [Acidimicrobiia bacterium]|nr:NADH-ubiquinone oxidoreductase-F iron-sulfur binding region domain-containing protein [Acidimicrobiia bacterium]